MCVKCERKHVETSSFVHSSKHAFEILPNGAVNFRRKTEAKTEDKLAQIDRDFAMALQLSETRGKNISSSGTKPPRPPPITPFSPVTIPPNVRWQFMGDSGSYHDYPEADARVLEVAYVLKKKMCELKYGFGHYSIKFKSTRITQMNLKTKRIRNVRRHIINNSGPQLTPQQRNKVNQLMSFLGGSEAECLDVLIKSNWDLQTAINKIFDG